MVSQGDPTIIKYVAFLHFLLAFWNLDINLTLLPVLLFVGP